MPDVAVVTGAGRGLGQLVASRLADRGLTVLLTDIDAALAERAAERIGRGAWARAQDVRDPASHRAVAAAAAARGPVRVWVNNAGVLRVGPAWENPEADIRLQVDVNLYGLIWGCRAAVEVMRARGGHLINLGSMSSHVPTPGLAVYGATKHAVLGYSVSLQGELDLAGLPIRVSVICPDAIATDMVKDVSAQKDAALLYSNGKLLDPDEVADVVTSVLDRHELVLTYPKGRALLAHVVAPFPQLSLKALALFRKIGEKARARHAGR